MKYLEEQPKYLQEHLHLTQYSTYFELFLELLASLSFPDLLRKPKIIKLTFATQIIADFLT